MTFTQISDNYIRSAFSSPHYKLLEKIGEGGFGKVYTAHQINTGQTVAIKFLALDPNGEETQRTRYVERFKRETLLCSKLHHPNIVRLLDQGQCNDKLLFGVFEYVDGQSLRTFLTSNGPMSPLEAQDIMLQLLDALIHAHQQGIIHRDIKPANVMLSKGGARTHAKILDFGIGTLTQDSRHQEFHTLTLTQETLGTPSYSAPEQLRGEPATESTDLYVWGLLFLECLTGIPAVSGSSLASIYHKQLSDAQVPIPQALLGHPIAGLLRRLLHKNPNDRVITGEEAYQELTRMNMANLVGALGTFRAANLPNESTVILRDDEPNHPLHADYTFFTERKQITVLAVRFSIALIPGSDSDLDVLDALFKSHRGHCLDIATRFGAYHVGSLGDTSLFYFGYPTASDNDTRLCARTALEVMSDLAKRNALMRDVQGATLNAHAGIHTGIFNTYANNTPEGHIANAALALARQAQNSQILCSREARSLLEPYTEFEGHDDLQLGLTSATEPVFKMVGERRIEAFGFMRGTRNNHELIGRHHELEQTLSMLNGSERHTRIAHIHGEAGIGKSRLLQEIRVNAPQYQHLVAQCLPEHQNSALFPILTLVRYLYNASNLDVDSASTMFSQIIAVQAPALNLAETLPVLMVWLNIDLEEKLAPSMLAPHEQKELLFAGLTALLQSPQYNVDKYKLYIVEDIHWADASTLEFLKYFASQLSAEHVLLSTSRQNVPTQLQELTLLEVNLQKLTEQATKDFVVKLFDGRDVTDAVLDLLVSRTDGIPLFIEELVGMLKQKELIAFNSNTVDFVSPDKIEQIPATLRESLQQKLDGLHFAKETAHLAALIGREFSYELLVEASQLTESQIQNDLKELIAADLIIKLRRVDSDRYIFKHALVREAAIEGLTYDCKTKSYKNIASALLSASNSAILAKTPKHIQAEYFIGARMFEQGLECLILVGNELNQKGAYFEAHNILSKAESVIEKEKIASVNLKIRVYLGVANCLSATRGFSDQLVEGYYLKINEQDLTLVSDELKLAASFVMSVFGIVTCQHELTIKALQELNKLANQSSSECIKAPILFQSGQFETVRGNPQNGFDLLQKSLTTLDPNRRGFYNELIAYDLEIAIGVYGALNAAQLAKRELAIEMLHSALQKALDSKHPHTIAHSYVRASQLYILLEDPDLALEYAEHALEISSKHGYHLWIAFAKCFKAWALSFSDNNNQIAISLFEEGTGFLELVGLKSHKLWLQALKSSILMALGRRDEASQLITFVILELQKSDEKLYQEEIYKIKETINNHA